MLLLYLFENFVQTQIGFNLFYRNDVLYLHVITHKETISN